MTKLLYEQDAYIKNFEAKVLSCDEAEGGYAVVLDQSAFFPEGGGQKGDVGRIGDATVSDTQLVGDTVVHSVDKPLEVGSEVEAAIDWEIRFERMQNHSAEHIICGIAWSLFGCNNVGFHMGESFMTVDLDGKLSKEELSRVELEANRAVYRNLPIVSIYPTKEEAESLQYRSKKAIDEGLRLVKIGDVDCCACCAPHVAQTGEIGVIKVIDFCPHKNGVRIQLIAGRDAFSDYVALNERNKAVMKLLSAPREGVPSAVEALLDTIARLNGEKQAIARELAICKLNPTVKEKNAFAFCDNCSFEDLRHCSNKLISDGIDHCLLFSQSGDNEYIYVVNSVKGEARAVVKALNDALGGKGGGKDNYAQGKVCGTRSEVEALAESLI